MKQLDNKVALITGGANGQGSAEARLFADEGAVVVISDIDNENGEKLAAELKRQGYEAEYIHMDVRLEKDWDNVVDEIRKKYGMLHILINNAGINGGKPIAFEDLQTWNNIYAVNVVGPMLGIRKCCRLMRDSGGGSIINIGSTAGTNGHFLAAYSSSKWAVRGLSKSAAFTLAEWGIRSNVICPGIINTQLGNALGPEAVEKFVQANAIQRMGEPEEIAEVALFLASDASAFITGQEISVDGGFDATAAYGQFVRFDGSLKKMMEQE